MATTPQVGAEGHAWSGILTSGSVPERYQKLDILGNMAWITRHNTPFLSMITQDFPKAKVKSKRVFGVHELEELKRTFTVSVASSDTNHQRFGVPNADAAEITENDMLYLRNTYATVQYDNMVGGQVIADGGTNVGPDFLTPVGGNPTGITFSRAYGVVNDVYFTSPEAVKIVSIGAKDSAGTGSTEITVRRCFFGPDGTDQGFSIISDNVVNTAVQADPTNAGFKVGDVFLRGLPSFKEGTGAPTGFHKNPLIDNNCTQEFKYAVERTKESSIDFAGLDYDPINIQRKLVNRRMMLDIERSMIFGRKGMQMDQGGSKLYTMGGVVEFIPKDEQHIIKYEGSNLNYSSFLDVGYKVLDLGGGTKRSCFIGVKLFNSIKKSFETNNAFRFNKEDTQKYSINIESVLVSGGELNLIPLHCMDEFGWGDKMLCLDLTVPSFVPVTHKGWDMKVETDIQEKGIQVYKEQVIGMKGLERRYSQFQSIIDFTGHV